MKIILAVFAATLLIGVAGCKKGSDVKPPQEVFTKFPPPTWQVDETGKYPATMTAVITVPKNLQAGITEKDRLGAFVNNECRGEGVMVKIDSAKVFFMLIRGLSDELSSIQFKYYNAGTSYMYQSQPVLNFHIDDVYGTAENPKIIDMVQLK